jgi:hypothetical protein
VTVKVAGLSWMGHQWGSFNFASGGGWDWFSMQLSNGGRVFGGISTLEGVTILAGTLGAGYLSRGADIIGVLAIQGGGYVVAGLAMLIWLKDSAGPDADPRRSEPVATPLARMDAARAG